jgi:hypothetical protein
MIVISSGSWKEWRIYSYVCRVSRWKLRDSNSSRMHVVLEDHPHEQKRDVGDYQKLSKFMRFAARCPDKAPDSRCRVACSGRECVSIDYVAACCCIHALFGLCWWRSLAHMQAFCEHCMARTEMKRLCRFQVVVVKYSEAQCNG